MCSIWLLFSFFLCFTLGSIYRRFFFSSTLFYCEEATIWLKVEEAWHKYCFFSCVSPTLFSVYLFIYHSCFFFEGEECFFTFCFFFFFRFRLWHGTPWLGFLGLRSLSSFWLKDAVVDPSLSQSPFHFPPFFFFFLATSVLIFLTLLLTFFFPLLWKCVCFSCFFIVPFLFFFFNSELLRWPFFFSHLALLFFFYCWKGAYQKRYQKRSFFFVEFRAH